MEESLKYQRQLTVVLAALSLVGLVIIVLIAPAFTFGWALGTLVGMGIFRYRAATVLSLFNRPREEWVQVSVKSSIMSYALTIITCGGAIILTRYTEYKMFHPFAVLGGILLERALLWADGFIRPFFMTPAIEEEQA